MGSEVVGFAIVCLIFALTVVNGVLMMVTPRGWVAFTNRWFRALGRDSAVQLSEDAAATGVSGLGTRVAGVYMVYLGASALFGMASR